MADLFSAVAGLALALVPVNAHAQPAPAPVQTGQVPIQQAMGISNAEVHLAETSAGRCKMYMRLVAGADGVKVPPAEAWVRASDGFPENYKPLLAMECVVYGGAYTDSNADFRSVISHMTAQGDQH